MSIMYCVIIILLLFYFIYRMMVHLYCDVLLDAVIKKNSIVKINILVQLIIAGYKQAIL